jgi:Fe2+ transport system protein B
MTIKAQILEELEQIPESRLETVLIYIQALAQVTTHQNLEDLFNTLVQQWRNENRFTSSVDQMVMHPAYSLPALRLPMENWSEGLWLPDQI